jgi:TolB-like protein/cytochrome c-type biogenesis protein CcmH/NrfG
VNSQNFLAELKRRNVYKVAVAYAVVSWLLLQAASILFPAFEAPPWVMKVFVAVLVLGFVPALIFAWAFEITPEGIRRESEIAPNESVAQHTGRKIVALTIAVAVLAAGLFAFQSLRPKAARVPATAATTNTPTPVPEKSIAVLPFENLSDDKSNAYFAAGIQDEILTRLSKIADLKVISRTSTQKYASAPDNLRAVGNQLGVANLLEGSVQKAGGEVHINVQLIRAATDAHLWAESYNRELQNIFGVEGEVAGKIAEALNARLTGTEEKAIAQKPTTNPEAYDAFLRARATDAIRFDLPGETEVANDYATAVRLDPNFALAWANLATVRSFLYFNAVDRATNSAAAIREAADRAFALEPELGEAWLARGAYRYRVLKDLPGALEAFEEALKRLPNSAEVFADMAFAERRMGRWDAAIAHFKKAAQLDPRNLQVFIYAGETLGYLNRFAEAHQFIDRALQIAPDGPRALLADVSLFQAEGRLKDAAIATERIKGDNVILIDVKTTQLMYERRFDDAAAGLQSFIKPMTPGGPLDLVQQALLPVLGYCQERVGRVAEARTSYALAVHEIKPTPETDVPVDQTHLPMALTLAYAGLGEKENALAAGRKAVADYENDALLRPEAEITLAQAEAQLGEIDAAIAELPHLLEVPAGLTPGLLKLDPCWDPLRKDPRFQKLLNSEPPNHTAGPGQ